METSKAYLFVVRHNERIASALKLYWGEREFVPYVQGLLSDARDGNRVGFPPDMVIALHNLLERHNREFPDFSPSRNAGIWAANQKIR